MGQWVGGGAACLANHGTRRQATYTAAMTFVPPTSTYADPLAAGFMPTRITAGGVCEGACVRCRAMAVATFLACGDVPMGRSVVSALSVRGGRVGAATPADPAAAAAMVLNRVC